MGKVLFCSVDRRRRHVYDTNTRLGLKGLNQQDHVAALAGHPLLSHDSSASCGSDRSTPMVGGPVVKGLSLYECHQILSDDRGITGCDLIILVFSFPAIMNEKL